MSGYTWQPILKYVPDNGADEVVDLRSTFTEGGPHRVDLVYSDLGEVRDTVNLDGFRISRGYRAQVTMTFDVITMDDHLLIANLVNRLGRSDYDVRLSLNGGTTYRSMELTRVPSPAPFNGRTAAGARFAVRMQVRDAYDELPTIPDDW